MDSLETTADATSGHDGRGCRAAAACARGRRLGGQRDQAGPGARRLRPGDLQRRHRPGTCIKDGTTTFSEFIAQLLAQGRAPAWRFAPEQLRLDAGGTLSAHNRGGEDHTFTEVASFGGGCIQALNDLLGLTPVPECAGFPGGAFAATLVRPGATVTTAPLPPGVHRYECLIHPWMQTTVTVG